LAPAEAPGVGADRAHRRDAVLDPQGKAMLRREAIIHRDDAAVSPARQRRAKRVVRIEAAGDPAPAMKMDERWKFRAGSPLRTLMA
jgi:hypothetical protein